MPRESCRSTSQRTNERSGANPSPEPLRNVKGKRPGHKNRGAPLHLAQAL
ncbi:phage DNA packaging protein J [Deinococcus taeanensis]|nr:phage DNA packaging protein J [Deinococcus taeanensis]